MSRALSANDLHTLLSPCEQPVAEDSESKSQRPECMTIAANSACNVGARLDRNDVETGRELRKQDIGTAHAGSQASLPLSPCFLSLSKQLIADFRDRYCSTITQEETEAWNE
jgi:hypothetical protein